MTRKILFTGSRDASPEMLMLVRDTLESIRGQDVHIIVGDADGVDYKVIVSCDELDIPFEVHGAYNKMRHKAWNGVNIAHNLDYLSRDRLIANLLEPGDECVAVWNGKSLRSGTIATARYAKKIGATIKWLYKIPNSL